MVLETDVRPRPAPLQRFVRLLPVDGTEALLESLRPFAGRLATAALDGFDPETTGRLDAALAVLGLSRVTRPGTLQTPPIDWPRDGLPLLLPMARFVRSD